MADPNNALDEVVIDNPVDAAIIEIAGIAERFNNFGEFRAELIGMSEGILTIAKNKAKAETKAPAKK